MLDSTVALISEDAALIETMRGVVGSIGNLRLEILAQIEEACSQLEGSGHALVIAHLTQSVDSSGVTHLLRSISSTGRPIPLLILSDQYHAEQALALLRLGAVDYLSRPLDIRRVSYLVDVLTVRSRCAGMASRSAPPSATIGSEPALVQSIGENEPFLYHPYADMGRMMEQVRTVAPQDTTVLLSGETGTGKTHLARLIHELSSRCDQPFLVVNCGALSSGLIESEMFGHVKGAFTGADRERVGKFSEVGRGTLLLDEIDALPLALQAKLLRAVEERIFEPVGSNKSQTMRARLIAASNRSLDQEATAGRFRSDLYYRLNVVGFTLPPLRNRPWTVGPLANQYVKEFSTRNGRQVLGMSGEVLKVLEAYSWPGNVRELRNVVERAVALCPGPDIDVEDLPTALHSLEAAASSAPSARHAAAGSSAAPSTLARTTEEAEIARITEVLVKHGNNRLRAAIELGISRMTLYKKLHKYGMIGAA
ncbi:MAG TPA: sigma-54 dependent transcriptional regulator [Isosphaeraceae bacterium]|jgi:DNA-binding NtrC family response regulator|nr:sigma-54 dependent transcriptional regulator [Isosphaeraceae bacterium]